MRYLVFLIFFIPSVVFGDAGLIGLEATHEAAGGGATDFTSDGNCVAAYFMNDTGNELDDSVNSNTLTETSGTIPTSVDVPSGYSGTSRDFEEGESEYLTQADGGGLDISGADQSLSIACWVKFESDTSADQMLVFKYSSVGDQRQYLLKYDDVDDQIEAFISSDGTSGGTSKAVTSSGWATFGTGWHHVAMVYNDTDVRTYIDGSLDGTPVAHTTGIYNSTTDFAVGATDGNTTHFDGRMDELIIMDRALSAPEVNDIYTDGISGDKGASD